MKKWIVLLFSAYLLVSCTKKASITIQNESGLMNKVQVDSDIYTIYWNSEPLTIDYYLDSYLLFSETQKVKFESIGSPFIKPEKFTITLKPGDTKKYTITKDRAVLRIQNSSFETIYQVLVQKDETSSWSDNLIEGYINPNNSADIPLELDYQFLKIVDAYSLEYPVEEIELVAGEYYHYTFTGYRLENRNTFSQKSN